MTTIAYDKPVADFIARLNETGHVTHTSYRKTSVTLHHNGGRLSHQGVLNVWKVRPASAHFDADGVGAIAQYVKVPEYAWAVGNTTGNQRTISIEMANSATAPSWTVADATWKSSARLTGWLFAKVIGVRPSPSNFFMHSHWSATACAGPYIKRLWTLIMAAAQAAYDAFRKIKPPVVPPIKPPTTTFNTGNVRLLQSAVNILPDGRWRALTDGSLSLLRAAAKNPGHVLTTVEAKWLQKIVGVVQDGAIGPKTRAGVTVHTRMVQTALRVNADGAWGQSTDSVFFKVRAQFNGR